MASKGRKTAKAPLPRLTFGLAMALLLALAPSAKETAQANPLETLEALFEDENRWREVWTGADAGSNVWLVYAGATVAPFSGVYGDGLRLRAVSGYGQYAYTQITARPGRAPQSSTFAASTTSFDALIGYQKRVGELTAKIFAGVSYIDHEIEPFDDQTVVAGQEFGFKTVVELWLNIGESAWSSLDLQWSTAHDTRSARARVGYRVWPHVSVGLEGGFNLDAQGSCRTDLLAADDCPWTGAEASDLFDYGRGGVFVRYDWFNGELSLAAGLLGLASFGETDFDPYITTLWLTQF